MEHQSKAKALFLAGYSCSQAVFAAFSDVTGLDQKEALRLSAVLGGGVGRMREICGAVSSMALVLGALDGNDVPDAEKKSALYTQMQAMADAFKRDYGTVVCRELLKLPEGGDSPISPKRDAAFYKDRPCMAFVVRAAALLDDWLASRA